MIKRIGATVLVVLASCSTNKPKDINGEEVQAFEHRSKSQLVESIERHGDVNRGRTREYLRQLDDLKSNNQKIVEYENELPYVGTRSVSIVKDLPPIFYENASLAEMQPLSLDMLANRLGDIGGMMVHFSDDVTNPLRQDDSEGSSTDSASPASFLMGGDTGVEAGGDGNNMTISIRRYEGSYKGLLDRIASQLNISWGYDHAENVVLFNRFITRSYRVFTAPVTDGLISDAGGESGGKLPGIRLSESVWQSTNDVIASMLSSGGRVEVNEGAGLVSVTDTIYVHESVNKFVKEMNIGNQRMVLVELEFLTIRSTEEITKGAAFDVLFNDGTSSGGLISGFANALGGGGLSSLVVGENNNWKGSSAIIESLSKLGHVHVSDRQFIRALNNQITPFRDIEYIPYISDQSVTITDGISSTATEQKEVKVGYSLNVLPAVMDDGESILLHLGISQVELISMESVETSDSFIQQPRRSERSYIEKVHAKSRETIVLTGFESRKTEFEDSNTWGKMLKWLGFKEKAKDFYETAVVIVTPVVFNSQSDYQYD